MLYQLAGNEVDDSDALWSDDVVVELREVEADDAVTLGDGRLGLRVLSLLALVVGQTLVLEPLEFEVIELG